MNPGWGVGRVHMMFQEPTRVLHKTNFSLFLQEDYNQLRPLSYANTDVFLICFSVVNPASYHNVQEEWVPELKDCMPHVPYVLIGTQVPRLGGGGGGSGRATKRSVFINIEEGFRSILLSAVLKICMISYLVI